MNKVYKLIRDLTPEECGWLPETHPKGEKVFIYHGHAYGCIGPGGVAVSLREGESPFFEVPRDALTPPLEVYYGARR